MGTAYTPGLTVSAAALIRKTRRLPLKGEVLVEVGEEVRPETLVARTELPGHVTIVRAADQLGVLPTELAEVLLVRVGDAVEAGQKIAETKGLFGRWFKTPLHAPVTGTVEHFTAVTGHLSIRHPPRPVEVNAYIQGVVAEVLPEEGAVIETRGALVQGIFGIGGERQGALAVLANAPEEAVPAERLTDDCRGKIVVVGGRASAGILQRARAVGAVGVVAGGVLDTDLKQLLGYDIGVAITGHEEVGFTLILTEGFGEITMARRTFELLKSLDGREASISGATQIRAGVRRPEVIIPRPELRAADLDADWEGSQELNPGTPIRLIREPFFGALGTVAELPPELVEIDTGAAVRVLKARLDDGRLVTVPRANVEIVGG